MKENEEELWYFTKQIKRKEELLFTERKRWKDTSFKTRQIKKHSIRLLYKAKKNTIDKKIKRGSVDKKKDTKKNGKNEEITEQQKEN